jgi:hypothetical protein
MCEFLLPPRIPSIHCIPCCILGAAVIVNDASDESVVLTGKETAAVFLNVKKSLLIFINSEDMDRIAIEKIHINIE